MKRCIVLAIGIMSFYSSVIGQTTFTKKDLSKLTWLCNSWQEAATKPGQSSTETWMPSSDSTLSGKGIHLKGKSTSFTENFSIIVKDSSIYYVSGLPDDPESVSYRLIYISENEFACVNYEHDFPRRIVYKKSGNRLAALLTGSGKSVTYSFVKK